MRQVRQIQLHAIEGGEFLLLYSDLAIQVAVSHRIISTSKAMRSNQFRGKRPVVARR